LLGPVSRNGFTLLELMLVAVIILCLVALSTPLFKSTYDDIRLTSTSKEIAAILNFCRERAIFERRDYRFRIDPKERSYRILAEDQEENGFKPLKGRWGRIFRIPEMIGLEADTEEILFSPDGSTTPAMIYLSNSENRTCTITTEGSTGLIKVYDYKKE